MTRWKKALLVAALGFALFVSLTAPALGGEAAVGEGGGGYLPLGDVWETSDTITITSNDISDWVLLPDQDNTRQGILTVTADVAWSVTVSDEDTTMTNGKMTEYDTSTGQYIQSNPAKLGSVMEVKATGEYGTDTYVVLPDGDEIALGSATGESGVEVPFLLKQYVSDTDPVSHVGRGYKIVITFTGSVD